MLVGTNWGITGVRLTPGQAPRLLPTALVTGLYSRHHGRERLRTDLANMPTYNQPLRMNAITPAPRVAYLDFVVTRTGQTLYLHVINRHMSQDLPVDLHMERLGTLRGEAIQRTLIAPVEDGETATHAAIRETTLPVRGNVLRLQFPARSVGVVEIALAG